MRFLIECSRALSKFPWEFMGGMACCCLFGSFLPHFKQLYLQSPDNSTFERKELSIGNIKVRTEVQNCQQQSREPVDPNPDRSTLTPAKAGCTH